MFAKFSKFPLKVIVRIKNVWYEITADFNSILGTHFQYETWRVPWWTVKRAKTKEHGKVYVLSIWKCFDAKMFVNIFSSWAYFFLRIYAIDCLFSSRRLIKNWKDLFFTDFFQSKMNPYFAFLWLNCLTVLLLPATITAAGNQMRAPLIYINNLFMENISIENHTIQTVSVQEPWECFRHCAKHCHCVAFQVSEKTCELLDTDLDGAIGNQVKKPGIVLYHLQQNGVRVSLFL